MTQQPSTYVKTLPVADPETQAFWDACKAHTLQVQRCQSCRRFYFWPRAICPYCQGRDVQWVKLSGKGTVHTFSVVRQNMMWGWREEVPYVVAIVELEDADRVQMMTNVVGCDVDKVACGMPVEVAWDDVTPEMTLPKFRPA